MRSNALPHKKTYFNRYHSIIQLTKYNISLALLLGFIIFSPRSAIADLAIDTIVDQVSKNDYTSYVQTLEGYGTRAYGTSGNTNAMNFISTTFNSFNHLGVMLDPFTYSSNTYYNVVATLPGVTHPDNVYIVGAHFDSVSVSPGADDNASGMAAVLEIASVLAQYSFQSTIKFIGFNVEEQGLVGSHNYATEAQANGDKILGMLNFDMIAYTGSNPNEDVDIFGDQWLVDLMVANATQYTSLNVQAYYGNTYGSDHYYFHSSLYPGSASLLAIENTPSEIWGGSNPYYHTANDTSDKLNFDFATDITKAGIATLAGLAQTIPEPATIYCLTVGLFIIGWTRYRRYSHCAAV